MRKLLIALGVALSVVLFWVVTRNITKCVSADPDTAIRGCTALIEAGGDRKLASVYYDRGNAYRKKRLYAAALADYGKAIALRPDYAKAYNGRAWTYHLQDEDDKGLPDAEKAVALAPKEADCHGTRAAIYEKLGRRAEAIADYRAALALDPHRQAAADGLKRLGAPP